MERSEPITTLDQRSVGGYICTRFRLGLFQILILFQRQKKTYFRYLQFRSLPFFDCQLGKKTDTRSVPCLILAHPKKCLHQSYSLLVKGLIDFL